MSDDADLDSILNSALDELDNDDKKQADIKQSLPTQIRSTQPATTSTTTTTTTTQQPTTATPAATSATEAQAVAEFQEFLAELQKSGMGGDIMSQFGDEAKMTEMMNAMSNLSATQPTQPTTTAAATTSSSISTSAAVAPQPQTHSSNIEQAIKMIAEGNKNTTPDSMPDFGNSAEMDEMFSKLMAEMGGAGGEGGEAGMDSMIEKLMQSMLSKDVLYAPMKDIEQRYPAWLEANKPPKISADEYDRYTKQYAILQRICVSFETQPDDMNSIMQLMTDMQQYGQPPTELVPLDANGESPFTMPTMPGAGALGGAGGGAEAGFDDPAMAKMLEEGCKQQ